MHTIRNSINNPFKRTLRIQVKTFKVLLKVESNGSECEELIQSKTALAAWMKCGDLYKEDITLLSVVEVKSIFELNRISTTDPTN